MNMGRGRPPGGRTDARERLLAEGRRRFGRLGYTATTMRELADACGLDAALISFHFGSKRGLFREAMRLPISPTDVLDASTSHDGVDADRLLANLIQAWEDPNTGPPLRVLVEAAMRDSNQRVAVRQYLEGELIPAIAQRLRGPARERRARAAVYVLAGAVLGHYVLGLHSDGDPTSLFADLSQPLAAAIKG